MTKIKKLNKRQIEARMTHMRDQEDLEPERLFWLSFVDQTLASDEKSLGVAIVRARGPINAVDITRSLGINPGGEVMIIALEKQFPEKFLNRLIPADEARTLL